MNKAQAFEFIRNQMGYVPYVAMFDIFNDTEEIPQNLIDMSVQKYEAAGQTLIVGSVAARDLIMDALKTNANEKNPELITD